MREAVTGCCPFLAATMTELEGLWRRNRDDQLIEAFRRLDEYGAEGQKAIRAEGVDAGLLGPTTECLERLREAECSAARSDAGT
jgi:hypothetical protein